jgi:hypothetical protein
MKLNGVYVVVKGTPGSCVEDIVWAFTPCSFVDPRVLDVVAIYGGPGAEEEAKEHAGRIVAGWRAVESSWK